MNAVEKRLHDAALRVFAEKGTSEISVRELAVAAGVARGTIYNNLESTDHLFQRVAAQLADEMDEGVAASYEGVTDPARRIAIGIRLYVRRAYEEPHWGRFLLNFGYTNEALRKLWSGPPMRDLLEGIESKRFTLPPEKALAGLGVVAGATMSAILGVVEGLQAWKSAGSEAAELTLRALGVSAKEALKISTGELPALRFKKQ